MIKLVYPAVLAEADIMSCDVRITSSIVLDRCSPLTHFRSQPYCANRSMSLIKDTLLLPATFNRSSPAGLARVVAASRFPAPRLPSLVADHPGLNVELVVGDCFDDTIDDGLDLAVQTGEITDASLVSTTRRPRHPDDCGGF
jgi:hypothetical protein